jgi:hypothetical protein
MKIRTLFTVDAIISLLLALGFLLGPATILKSIGLSTGKTEVLLAQVIGAALVGLGALAWLGRDIEDPAAYQPLSAALLLFSGIAFVVVLLGLLAQATRAGGAWLLAVVLLLLTVGYGWFQFTGASE